jgi:poly(A) polymerase
MELLKLLAAARAAPTLAVTSEAGLLEQVIGGVPLLASASKMIGLEASLSLAADPVRRLAALGILVREDAERLRDRLRLANAEFERLDAMAEAWERISPSGSDDGDRGLLYRLGPQTFIDSVLLAWSRATQDPTDARWRAMATLPARWEAPAFPLKAADLLARGMTKGSALGAALRRAQEVWIAEGFPRDPDSLARIADAAARTTVS